MSKYIALEDIKNALIEIARSKKWLGRETTTNIINALVNLPTIEVSEEVLKATKNFNAYTIADENAEMGMRTQIEPIVEVSEDCISKDWLKTELEKWSLEEGRRDAWDNWNKAIETLIEIIDDAPSVTPEQSSMVGEWVEVVKRTEQYDREGVKSWAVIYQCPYCGFVLNAIENHTAQYNYCPTCGAKMKGADDD